MDINIAFGINDSFSQHCACVIASILYNASTVDNYKFYIFTDYISDDNKQKIESLRKLKPFTIQYITVSAKEFEKYNIDPRLGAATFFRLKIFDLKDCEKILYLDSDIIVRHNIAELYKTDITNYCCAGVEDIENHKLKKKFNLSPTTTYVNAGVLLLNIKYCIEQKIPQKIMKFLNSEHELNWFDQDILNYVFQDMVKTVDLKWNCIYCYRNTYEDQEYYHEMAQDPHIIHYVTDIKPWKVDAQPHLKQDYFIFLYFTPYYKEFMKKYIAEEKLYLSELNNQVNK